MGTPYDRYKELQVQTASKEKLVSMLYEGAILFLERAMEAIDKKDIELAHKSLMRVEDILFELMSSLDMEAGGEIAKNLMILYEYMNYRTIEANVSKDKDIILEVKGMFETLKSAWDEAMEKLQKEKASMEKGGGINIAG